MVITQAKFSGTAEHAMRLNPSEFCLLDFEIFRQDRTHAGKCRQQPLAYVRCATHNLHLRFAVIYCADAQFIRVRVSSHCFHFTHHHICELASNRFHTVYFQTSHRHLMQERFPFKPRIYPGSQPRFTDLHLRLPCAGSFN